MKRIAGVLLLILLAGCSGGSSGDSKASGATRDALKSAVYNYTNQLANGDADTAFAAVSNRCQIKIGHDTFVAGVQQIQDVYGGVHLTSFQINTFSPPTADVSYGAGGVQALQRDNQTWTYEGGSWRYDAC